MISFKATITVDTPTKEVHDNETAKKTIVTPKDVGNSMQFTKAADNSDEVKEKSVDEGKLIKPSAKKDALTITIDKEMKLIDDAIERDKARIIKERIEPLRKLGRKVMEEKALNGELDLPKEELDITSSGEKTSSAKKDTPKEPVKSPNTSQSSDSDSMESLDASVSELNQIKALDFDDDEDFKEDNEVLDDIDASEKKDNKELTDAEKKEMLKEERLIPAPSLSFSLIISVSLLV